MAALPAHGAGAIGLFVSDSDTLACVRALAELDIADTEIRIFTDEDIRRPDFEAFVRNMDVAVVDIMQSQPSGWLLEQRAIMKPEARIYAVRNSGRTDDFLNAGFKMDRAVRAYFDYTSAGNIANMIRFLAHRDLGVDTPHAPPMTPPENGLYHPDAPAIFPDPAAYAQWYRSSGRYREGALWDLTVIFPTSTLEGKKAPVDALIRAYESRGINTVTWMRATKDWEKTLDRLISSPPLAGNLGSITGFAFKFSSMFTVDLLPVLQKADVPVINAQNLFFATGSQWRASESGIPPRELTLQFSNPEISGLVEPTVVGAKERDPDVSSDTDALRFVPVQDQVALLARRAARWHALKRKPNRDKKIVLIYYNHGAGKQNIGASYLNVFRSIDEIIQRLKAEGYRIEGDVSEAAVKDLLLKAGRNIGSWAPAELDHLLAAGHAALIPFSDYRRWFSATPPPFQQAVNREWGPPDQARIMVKDGKFVIPHIRLGNLILAPQPMRGLGDDPDKLYHSTTLYPHHQYNAFYFWLQHQIQPDAMISLGTHGTHEWLPGKQAGLSAQCPPEVLIGEIPSLYPYIVDDVGEGIQAKRRGRGVIIDHAVPPFKRGGVYEEYATLTALIGEFETAASDPIRDARLARIARLTTQLGLDKDLGLASVTEDALERIEHYLLTLRTEMIPYGLHTFGVSPSDEALRETAQAMAERGSETEAVYADRIRACGPSEMDALIRGLSGGYIEPGSGNDPMRNPESLPTGKNFHAFDPHKVPSREAWHAGSNASRDIIAAYRETHGGAYPRQVGLVLWSVETIRDEGINIATALHLMGMTPVWDHRDKVIDVVPIAAAQLNRPRIDVLLQMSGLFRDTFPQVALMLDQAVKKAATLTDLDNFIRNHSAALEKTLIAQGASPAEARQLSLVRLFSAPPGAYGTKVNDMAGSSGMWETDDSVAEQGFVQMQSFGYSAEIWGEAMQAPYREHLKSVDATVHTISSNLYGAMDNDDMFQYLGGLSMAVRKASGKDPEVFVSMQRTTGGGRVEPLAATLGREMRTRYLNPRWIEGMKRENYAGAREMADFLENMWGWQVTTPAAVDSSLWRQSYEVYVEDKYGQDIRAFFNQENPWAYQSMTARMLEAVRKQYWNADAATTKKLAAEYAVSVVEKGVACCDHTCNNPLLHQMVVSLISLPGVLSPEMVAEFKLAVEQAAQKPLAEQVTQREALLEKLRDRADRSHTAAPSDAPMEKAAREPGAAASETPSADTVQGYKMEDMNQRDDTTEVASSGIQWAASLFVLLILALVGLGIRRKTT